MHRPLQLANILLMSLWLLVAAVAQEPIRIADNEAHVANFRGDAKRQHTWTITLPESRSEPFSTFQVRVESPTARVSVFLYSQAGDRVELKAANRQSKAAWRDGVIGQHLEAASVKPLGGGTYTLRIIPNDAAPGQYSVQVLRPLLGTRGSQTPDAPLATASQPPSPGNAQGPASQDVQDLKTRLDALERRMKRLEDANARK